MTNFNQIFIFSALLLSCSSAKNMNEINKDFTIISAEKSIWFGGRDGVKGTLYKFILKNNQNKTFRFTNLKIGSNKYPIRVDIKKDSIFISASVSSVYSDSQLDVDTGKPIENTKPEIENGTVSLIYYLSTSNTLHSILLKNIRLKETAISREALPN